MVINKDEALRSLDIAKAAYKDGNISKAIKFVKKSISLHETTEAKNLLELLSSSDRKPTPTSSASSARHRGKQNASHTPSGGREHNQGRQVREYTKEQEEVVKNMKRRNWNDYYDVLGLQKSASESEIKKAYRKLALQLHPDKNSAPGADEAFKALSKSFAVLGDEDKRRQYDQLGCDPDIRGGGPSMSGFGGRRNHGGFEFESEVDPEELFRMFFGEFAGNGFHSQFHMPRSRRTPTTNSQTANSNGTAFLQLLPLFLLIFVSLINSMLNPSSPSTPEFSFTRSPYFSEEVRTSSHSIPVFVNQKSYSEFISQSQGKSFIGQWEDKVENQYFTRLSDKCRIEIEQRERKFAKARGWGFGKVDERLWRDAKDMPMPNCEQLRRYGFAVPP